MLPYSACSFLRISLSLSCGEIFLLIHLMFHLGRRFLLRLVFSLFGFGIFLSTYLCVLSFFPHLLEFVSFAGHLCIGVPQNLHGLFPLGLIFGFEPNFSYLCIGSSFIVCLVFAEISSCGIVIFLFFFIFVLFINSVVFFNYTVFFYINCFRNFLSVHDVLYLDIISSSAEIVLKLHFLDFDQSSPDLFGCLFFRLICQEEMSAVVVSIGFR